MQKIAPFLWFDSQAEEAANFYCSIFENSRIVNVSHVTEEIATASGQPEGSVLTVSFVLDGVEFMALNGGPIFKFTEAISLLVHVEDQAELDRINAKLIADGGEQGPCGWVKDKFGLSWQVVPAVFERILTEGDPEKLRRFMAAMLQMTKFDVAALENA